jgi:hypothetical protein
MWTQLWVRADGNANTPAAMQQVDQQLQRFGGLFCAPDGMPVQEADGTFEVRVLGGDPGFVKYMLEQSYRIKVVREERHVD